MSQSTVELSANEREVAREFWDALVFPPSRFRMDEALAAFGHLPVCVQLAVLISMPPLSRGHSPEKSDNPFLLTA